MTAPVLIFAAVAGGALALIGLALLVGGALGLLRFTDVYARAHALAAPLCTGAALVCVGLGVAAWTPALSARLCVLGLLAYMIGPALAHMAVNAAHIAGVTPRTDDAGERQ